MTQSIDLKLPKHINFDGLPVKTLQLNKRDIWVVASDDILRMRVSSTLAPTSTDANVPYTAGTYCLQFDVDAINDVEVTFNNFSKTITAGTSERIVFIDGAETQETGELIIKGACTFSVPHLSIRSGSSDRFVPIIINEILEWKYYQTSLNYCAFGTASSIGNAEFTVPSVVKHLYELSLGGFAMRSSSGGPAVVKRFDSFNNTVVHLPDGLEYYTKQAIGNTANTTSVSGFTLVDNYCLYVSGVSGEVTVPDGIRGFASSSFTYDAQVVWPTGVTKINLNEDGALKVIQENAFSSITNLAEVSIPASVKKICTGALSGTKLNTFLFKTLPDAEIEIVSGAFGSGGKSAKTITVYTDNETVKNAVSNLDNITAKVYPTYMYGWPELATPTVSLSGATLTITPVENATHYQINKGSGLMASKLFETTELVVDLAQYQTTSAETIGVIARDNTGNYGPSAAASATLPALTTGETT